jgi:hypothetical protein
MTEIPALAISDLVEQQPQTGRQEGIGQRS